MCRATMIASAAWARRSDAAGAAVSPPPGREGALAAVGAWESAPPFGPRFVFATGRGTGDNNGA
jgi:hypothetical protein